MPTKITPKKKLKLHRLARKAKVSTEKMMTRVSNRKLGKHEKKSGLDRSLREDISAPYYDFSSPQDFGRFNEVLTSSNPYPVQFVLQKNGAMGDFAYIEEDLLIAPVAVLQKNHMSQKILGVFAKKDFKHHVDLCLGEYTGELMQTKAVERNKQFDADYAFDLKNGTTLTAKSHRGWPAMVNATSCYESANVQAKEIKGRVYFYLIRSIKASEQFLIYYGDDYKFKDKRFLNPSDNWAESIDKYNQYKNFYKPKKTLDRALVELLALGTKQFAIPNSAQIRNCTSVDIPILACSHHEEFLLQNKQENMSLLMLACWQGDIVLVQDLLTLGSNPHQQTTIHGYSALHFIVLSPHLNQDQKIELIETIVNMAGSTLKLQDSNDETILHIATKTHQTNLVQYILRKNATMSRYGTEKSILNCINVHDQDIFVMAMSSPHLDMIEKIIPYMRLSDINDCFEDPEPLHNAFNSMSAVTPEQLLIRIKLIFESLTVDEDEKRQFIKLISKGIVLPNNEKKQLIQQINGLISNSSLKNHADIPIENTKKRVGHFFTDKENSHDDKSKRQSTKKARFGR